MALETGTYISDLVATNPVNATDKVQQGDDHIRLIKSTLLATFPNIDAAMTATEDDLNLLAGAVAGDALSLTLATFDLNGDLDLDGQDHAISTGAAGTVLIDPTSTGTVTLGGTVDFNDIALQIVATATLRPDAGLLTIDAETLYLNPAGAELPIAIICGAGGINFVPNGDSTADFLWHESNDRWEFDDRLYVGGLLSCGGEIEAFGPLSLQNVSQISLNVAGTNPFIRPNADITRDLLFDIANDRWQFDDALIIGGQLIVVGGIDSRSSSLTTDNDTADEPGFKGMPVNTQNGDYTLVLADAGKLIRKASGGSGETITIPANASVAFPVGTVITIVNNGGGALSIAITSDTLTWSGAGSTGARTLADDGEAVIKKVASTEWMIAGAGLT